MLDIRPDRKYGSSLVHTPDRSFSIGYIGQCQNRELVLCGEYYLSNFSTIVPLRAGFRNSFVRGVDFPG